MYAFDQRARNMVYVRDKTSLPTAGSNPNSPPPTATGPGPQPPTGNFQFERLADLFQFQGRLTGEDVVLDISAVRWLKLCKLNARDTTTFTSVRVQLWHEPRTKRSMGSDTASIVTAGTALSGPVRERVVANSSRLMVFLGRMEAFITVFGEFIPVHTAPAFDMRRCLGQGRGPTWLGHGHFNSPAWHAAIPRRQMPHATSLLGRILGSSDKCAVTDDVEIEKKKGLTVKVKARKYGGLGRAKSRGGVLGEWIFPFSPFPSRGACDRLRDKCISLCRNPHVKLPRRSWLHVHFSTILDLCLPFAVDPVLFSVV
jgi:hypothetical protein